MSVANQIVRVTLLQNGIFIKKVKNDNNIFKRVHPLVNLDNFLPIERLSLLRTEMQDALKYSSVPNRRVFAIDKENNIGIYIGEHFFEQDESWAVIANLKSLNSDDLKNFRKMI